MKRLLALAFFTVLTTTLHTDRSKADEAEQLSICFTSFAPFSYLDKGVAAGLSPAIMREAARRSGFTIEFSEVPWPRCLEDVRNGYFHIALDSAEGRHGYLYFEPAAVPIALGIAVRKDSPLQTLDDLRRARNKRGLIIRGTVLPSEIDEFFDTPPRSVGSIRSILKMLELGRGDFTPIDLVTFRALEQDTDTDLRFLTPPVTSMRIMPLFHTGQTAQAERLARALNDMRTDDTLNRIYREQIGVSYDELKEIVAK